MKRVRVVSKRSVIEDVRKMAGRPTMGWKAVRKWIKRNGRPSAWGNLDANVAAIDAGMQWVEVP